MFALKVSPSSLVIYIFIIIHIVARRWYKAATYVLNQLLSMLTEVPKDFMHKNLQDYHYDNVHCSIRYQNIFNALLG